MNQTDGPSTVASVRLERAGAHLHIVLVDGSGSQSTLYDSATDAATLGGTWFGGGGGLCVEEGALVTLADGTEKPIGTVSHGEALRAVDLYKYAAAVRGGVAPDVARAAATISSTVLAHYVSNTPVGGHVQAWTIPHGVRGAARDTVVAQVHGIITADGTGGGGASVPWITPAVNVRGTRKATAEEAARVTANGMISLHNLKMSEDMHAIIVNGVLLEGLRNGAKRSAGTAA